jgi:hypothetical protein
MRSGDQALLLKNLNFSAPVATISQVAVSNNRAATTDQARP